MPVVICWGSVKSIVIFPNIINPTANSRIVGVLGILRVYMTIRNLIIWNCWFYQNHGTVHLWVLIKTIDMQLHTTPSSLDYWDTQTLLELKLDAHDILWVRNI